MKWILKAVVFYLAIGCAAAESLPGTYFKLLEAGSDMVEKRLNEQPGAGLKELEMSGPQGRGLPWTPGWRHFPYAILAPAVLYTKRHIDNPHYQDPKMLKLALRLGDLFASEDEKGLYEPRGDSDWDTYIWLEAYRILENELGDARRGRWKKAILKNTINDPLRLLKERVDFPWYQSPYIGTSPNHYSQYAYQVYLAGVVFDKPDWEALGARVLRRFALEDQTPDGYWGEHSAAGPTIGYNHLTLTTLGVYWEHSKDPDVLPALRRALDFHMNLTWPNGRPVEVANDRNRRWRVSSWGHFAFSHFPDGRRYAEFLTSFFRPDRLDVNDLGRLAQNALYYHDGPMSPIPQDSERYVYRMKQSPIGIRKTAPWTVALSGVIDTQAVTSQFYLDRQGNLSIFHEKLGQIVNGANSKRQPELATFTEKLRGGKLYHLPVSSRLQMPKPTAKRKGWDRLALSFNSFFAELYVAPASQKELSFQFDITGRGRPPEVAELNLQLVLKAGETLETGAGKKIVLGAEKVELSPEQIGGWIRHHGWTLEVDPTARLVWPIYPYYPYGGKREELVETSLEHAVGRLTVPLQFHPKRGGYIRVGEQSIEFTLRGE